jgi:hypothetical protein|tara:strand:- start:558 stop:1313 length:756 start_codon:yes stop_codon:yes gene_type:complete
MFVHISINGRLILRWCFAVMICLTAGAAFSWEMQEQPEAVVELFTSQGCLPCPAADRILTRLGDENKVITLSYHVDFWDYAGWADTFALPANGELQKAYAKRAGTGRIYTPQMIFNGERAVVGSSAEELRTALESASLELSLNVEIESQDIVNITAGPRSGLGNAIVWLVTFRDSAEVDVASGENMGQRLSYSHIVTSRRPVGMWDPTTGMEISIPVPEVLGPANDGFALIIQEKDGALPGRILGAVMVAR